MNRAEIRKAVVEAERFLERARQALGDPSDDDKYIYDCSITASIRRSSLDLTKQLAQMRHKK